MATVTITLVIDDGGDDESEVADVVDRILDNGTLQDEIEAYARDMRDAEWTITSAVVQSDDARALVKSILAALRSIEVHAKMADTRADVTHASEAFLDGRAEGLRSAAATIRAALGKENT